MRYSAIKDFDVVNGEGIRVSFWVTGCPHKCVGCHNKELWNRNTGKLYTEDTKEKIIKLLSDDRANKGLSILGGEPLAPYNREEIIKLCKDVKDRFPKKSIWIWTGYDYEYVCKEMDELLLYVDVLIDGKFEEELKDTSLLWMGSSNQRKYDIR